MLICKVVKPLVSTNRIPDFEHKHLLVVLDGSTQKVAVRSKRNPTSPGVTAATGLSSYRPSAHRLMWLAALLEAAVLEPVLRLGEQIGQQGFAATGLGAVAVLPAHQRRQ